MLNELEQKIRKAIPELNELGVGCELSVRNKFYTIVDSFNVGYTLLSNSFNEILHHETKEILNTYNIIGKPIQLNHVLEYVKMSYPDTFYSKNVKLLYLWNLKSNLLSEQSEELWRFILELKKD